jgi:hypothetical protein
LFFNTTRNFKWFPLTLTMLLAIHPVHIPPLSSYTPPLFLCPRIGRFLTIFASG